MLELTVNGEKHTLEIDPGTPLLWALRDHLHLRGTKYGCGIGLCGSCTVHVDGRAARACLLTVADVGGQAVTTIEGLSPEHEPVQQAWQALQVPQCGYCQPGMIMASVALLREKPSPNRGGHRGGDHQHLPLRHLQPGAPGHPGRGPHGRDLR
jgi:isoquinoline 1-oxidoreductase subunit alpha